MSNYKYFSVGRVFLLALLLVSSFFILFTFTNPIGAAALCDDGIDNDGDGAVDYTGSPNRGDQGCSSLTDNDEGFRLRVSVSGKGTVTSTGINCSSSATIPTCKAEYDNGTTLSISATPLAGFRFKEWVGACTGTVSPCSVTMSQARDVLAVFETTGNFTLTVNQSGAYGSIYSNPPGINGCSAAVCTGSFPSGSTVRLYTHLGNNADGRAIVWTSCDVLDYEPLDSGGLRIGQEEADCEEIIDGNDIVSLFVGNKSNPSYFPISVAISGSGSGRVTGVERHSGWTVIHCGSDFTPLDRSDTGGCHWSASQTANFGATNTITLTASPHLVNGSTFGGWGGACTGTQTTCVVEMTQARNVTATFNNSSGVRKHRIYAKRLSTLIPDNGNHGAVISSAPSGIACGGDCGEYYQIGTAVNLTPTLALGYDYPGDFYVNGQSLYGMCIGAAPLCRIYVSQPYHLQTQSGPVCNDKVDNDGDNLVDGNGVGGNARDPQCVEPPGYFGNENGTTEGPSSPAGQTGTLTVTKNVDQRNVPGNGLVVSTTNPNDPINCGADCTAIYDRGSFVDVSGTPNPGSYLRVISSPNTCSYGTSLKNCRLRMGLFQDENLVNFEFISGPACNDGIDNDKDGIIDYPAAQGRTIKKGDLVQDGIIDPGDNVRCLRLAEGLESITAFDRIAGDVNGDGRITVGSNPTDLTNETDDCNIILRWSVDLPTPVRPPNVLALPDGACVSATQNTENPNLLTVNVSGTGSVSGSSGLIPNPPSISGCVQGGSTNICTERYEQDQIVTLTATPGSGMQTNWGNCTPSVNNPNICTTTMDVAKTVTATFVQNTFLLTTGRTSVYGGSGTVSAVYGANSQTCNNGSCNYQVDQNSNVTLTAFHDDNSIFVRWVDSGTVNTSTVCPGGSPCTFSMNAPKTVFAEFRRFRCSDTANGGALDNDGDGLANYPADPGCASALDDDEGARLRVTTVGNGMASIMFATDVTPAPWNPGANPPWIYSCRSTVDPNSCNEHYNNNTDVSVTLSADPGYTGTWTGCDSLSNVGTNNPNNKCKVNIRNYLSRNITATFTALPACSNRLDDDGDGLIDMGYDWNGDGDYNDVGEYSPDPGCSSPTDTQEGFRLTTTVSGGGSVSATSPADPGSNPPWIDNCTQSGTASTCSEHYDSGVSVMLTATPIPAGQVIQWTGCTSASGNICNVLMNSMKQVNVTFIPSNACTDRLDNDGDGLADTSGVDLNGDGDFTDAGEFAPDPGCAGGGNDEKPRLQVNVVDVADSRVTINSSPAGITNCTSSNTETSACNEHYVSNTIVTLTSSRGEDTNWTGCSVPSGSSCTVTMNSSKIVIAEPRNQCNDGIDNDGDGLTDFPSDTVCSNKYWKTEGITISCVGVPSVVSTGEEVVWTATVNNATCPSGTSNYSYSWTGAVVAVNNSGIPTDTETNSYSTIGTKIATVQVSNTGSTGFPPPFACGGTAVTSCQIDVVDSLRLTSGRVDLNPIDGEALGNVRMRIGDISTICWDLVCSRNVQPDNNNVGVTADTTDNTVVFVRWVGADTRTQSTVCPGNTNPCNFDMDVSTTVYAEFRHTACSDRIDNDGDGLADIGGVDLNGDGDFTDLGEFPPDLGCDGPGDDDENPKLTVVKTGTGTGRVYSNPMGISFPSGIDCGPICVDSFETDSTVVLTAIPNPLDNSRFVGWSDNCAPIDAFRCEVAMDISRQVTAVFSLYGVEICTDGIDNDFDGAVDDEDSDCRHQCNDGIDNDEDGGIDSTGAQTDPECINGSRNEGITAYCEVSPSPVDINEDVTWKAYVRNACPGAGNFTFYSWQDHLSGAGNVQQVVRQYSTSGMRYSSVLISNRRQDDPSGSCGGWAISPQCTNDTGGPGVYVRPPQSPQILNLGIMGDVTLPNANSISESSALLDNCRNFSPDLCRNDVFSGDEFLLTYNRAPGHAFVAWRGDQCAGSFARTCAVIMPELTQTIRAEFRLTECNDGEDNNGDGKIDMGLDSNGDGDYDIPPSDYWPDPTCVDLDDDREGGGGECDDGLDNDTDGLVDEQDPMCWETDPITGILTWNPNLRERDPRTEPISCPAGGVGACPKCNDGVDNDSDGFIDHAGACYGSTGELIPGIVEAGCVNPGDVWHGADPFCQGDPARKAESFSQLFQEF